jgi:uncharacterized protein YmfQ (DUF2313 family)
MTNFRSHTLEENTTALAQYLPNDRLFAGKNIQDDDLRELLTGVSGELTRTDELFQTVWDNTNILTTNDEAFMSKWESMVGIPDDCFSVSNDFEERRNNVLVKLRSLGVLTNQNFVDLAATLGVVITITPLSESLYPPYDVPFIPVGQGTRFVATVKGPNLEMTEFPPYDVPFIPTQVNSIIRCLFDILKPANVKYIYVNS